MKQLSVFLFSLILLASCSPGKKFSYKDAYYFDYYTFENKAEENHDRPKLQNDQIPGDPVLSGSIDDNNLKDVIIQQDVFTNSPETEAQSAGIIPESKKKMVPAENHTSLNKSKPELTREEKRLLKKEIKEDIRDYKKKVKDLKKEAKTSEMTENIRLGLIIGGIGLIVAILGGSSVLGTLGALAFLAGLVLIVIDLIKYY